MFEVHHVIPISEIGMTRTKLKDLALLCANCHRYVHRLIKLNGGWLTISECKVLLNI
ncbi:HNH endonuclease [Acidicapsa dinghuensis]|uniref:HNH endonuclease n=1 Tax=Acidicapsa dinghuensis TaxID=2218256 RepID=A0ABW1EKL6_9BACT